VALTSVVVGAAMESSRMLATVVSTNSSTITYGVVDGVTAWIAWVCFLEWGLIHILAGVITYVFIRCFVVRR
jgi:hypothetical protein